MQTPEEEVRQASAAMYLLQLVCQLGLIALFYMVLRSKGNRNSLDLGKALTATTVTANHHRLRADDLGSSSMFRIRSLT